MCDCPDPLEYWIDCPKAGHEEGCFATKCFYCDEIIYSDCEEVNV